MNQVIKKSIVDGCGFCSYELPEYGHGDFFALIQDVLSDFVVATISVSDGDGSIVALDGEKALKILSGGS